MRLWKSGHSESERASGLKYFKGFLLSVNTCDVIPQYRTVWSSFVVAFPHPANVFWWWHECVFVTLVWFSTTWLSPPYANKQHTHHTFFRLCFSRLMTPFLHADKSSFRWNSSTPSTLKEDRWLTSWPFCCINPRSYKQINWKWFWSVSFRRKSHVFVVIIRYSSLWRL